VRAIDRPTRAPGEGELDGRRLRREQNRETVLDALAQLFEEGVYSPSSGEIAVRAGLSPRSLFRYFDDIDELQRAVIDRELARARPLLDVRVDPAAPTAEKIRETVESRVRLFESTEPAARSARACAHRHPVVAAQLEEARTYLRTQLRRLFAPELAGERASVLPAMDVLCSFESYDLLRSQHGLSRAKVTAILTASLTALLAHTDHER
jgi:AcrR family transcriptional regulator